MIRRVDHIGIAVDSLEKRLPFWAEALGLSVSAIETVETEQVKVAFLPVGDSRIELLNANWLAGALPPAPHFELHLVLWDDGELCTRSQSLCELTRDLAESARDAMADERELSERLGTVRCLRANPMSFDGRLEQIWAI